MFAALLPFLSSFAGGSIASSLAASAVAGGIGLLGQRSEAKRQARADKADQAAIAASEAASQAAYRDNLRKGASGGRGSGSFRTQGTSPFTPTLKQLTGQ